MEYKYRDILEKILVAIGKIPKGLLYELTATGNIATFKTNLVKPVKMGIPITPVQDLNGFDRPIPPGLSDNIVNEQSPNWVERKYITDTGAVSSDNSYRYINEFIPVSPDTTYTFQINKQTSASCGSTLPQYDANKEFIDRITLVSSTTSTGVLTATFTTGVNTHYIKLTVPLSSNRVMIAEGSVVPDYAPYANVCPLTGLAGCNVSVTNKNLVDISLADWESNFLINDYGARAYSNSYRYTQHYYKVKGSGTVTWSFNSSTSFSVGSVLIMYDSNKNFIGRIATGRTVAQGHNEFTGELLDGTAYVRFNAPRTGTITNFQLEYAQSATEYEPVTMYNIEFPNDAGTVYGGTLTINNDGTATLVADHAIVTLTENTSYTYDETTHSYVTGNIATGIYQKSHLDTFQGKCSTCLPYTSHPAPPGSDPWATIRGACFVGYTGNNDSGLRFSINGSRNDNIATILAGTEVTYKLSQTRTFTLTAEQINTLKGTNNIWTDTDEKNTIKYMKRG